MHIRMNCPVHYENSKLQWYNTVQKRQCARGRMTTLKRRTSIMLHVGHFQGGHPTTFNKRCVCLEVIFGFPNIIRTG